MKPKVTNQKKAYSELNDRLKDYSDSSELLLESLNGDIASTLSTIDVGDDVFNIKDHTEMNGTINKVRNAFILGLWNIISNAIDKEWGNAQEKVGLLIKNASSVYDEDFVDKYRATASESFKKRNVGGLTISQRLWQRYYDYRDFIEASISTSIRKGMNVGQIKTALTNDLQNINSLRSNYNDRFGSVPKIKDVKYYISRLVSSEINMAYRESEQQRWRQLDFVLGFQIHLSGSHKDKDICDDLAGIYPKSFKWYGWHPLDRCYMSPVLMTDTDFWEWNNSGKKQGEITDVPQNFKQWVDDNAETINTAKSSYLFLADNWNGRLKDYARYKTDSNYRDVVFDYFSGGMKATHTEHTFDKKKGWYEKTAQNVGYTNGHSVILERERHDLFAVKNTEGFWDNMRFEIAAAETATPNNIRNALKHCASKPNSEVAIIFFPNNNFSSTNFNDAYGKFHGLKGSSQYKQFSLIFCVGQDSILEIKKPD